MNNTFNIQRLGLLLKRQWLEFGKIYLITLAVALGVIITFYWFSLYPYLIEKVKEPYNYRLNFREPLFVIFGFLFITVIASSYFVHLGQKPKAIIDLMIPASTFEKFLASIFFTAILSTVSFLVIFYLTDLAFISKLRSVYHGVATESFNPETGEKLTGEMFNLSYFFTRNYPENFTSIFLVAPFFITSIFLLGSIYFNKFHYIKTSICVMIFSGIWTWIIVKAGQGLFEGKILIQHGGVMDVDNPKLWAEIGAFALMLLLTGIFWVITYVRLKEKEV